MPWSAPARPASRIASTGKIVTKIAAKSFATSTIGAQWNWLCSRTAAGVIASDATPSRISSEAAHASCELDVRARDVERDAGIPQPGHQHGADHAGQQQEIRQRPRRDSGGAIGTARPAPAGSRADGAPSRARRRRRAASPTRNSVGIASARVVQKKSTPFRKPMKSGGSPSGDSAPPTLPTSRMKNTTACTLCRRVSLAVSSGRISSIDAPVVPMTLASARAQREQAGVDRGRSGERAAKADAAGDREQREQHREERNVLEHDRVRDVVQRLAGAERRRERDEERERPQRRDLAVVVVPELRREQRNERDRQQQAGERQSPEQRQRRAVEGARARALRSGVGDRSECMRNEGAAGRAATARRARQGEG